MSPQSSSIPNFRTDFRTSVCVKPKPAKRLAPLSVRLSAEQRRQLEQDAVGMSLNAYVLSRLFDDPDSKKKSKRKTRVPTKRDKAIAQVLRRMGHAGIATFLVSQIVAQEEGRLILSDKEETELRGAYAEWNLIRRDLVEALGLIAEYDTSFVPVTKGK